MKRQKLTLSVLIFAMFALVFASRAYAADDTLPKLTDEEWKAAKKIFFDRCAGCHGTLRKGATGPALTTKRTHELGVDAIEAIITEGTPGGMPAWGKAGILSPKEVNLMARFLQHEPVAPPEMSLADMKQTWKVSVPVDKRPTQPVTKRDWQNFFGVVERDAGKVMIIDGDTKEKVAELPTGYAVHILRSSKTGRYFFVIGRDGKVTMIDLWTETPQMVAEVKVCSEARSVETSKFKGYEDKLAIVGCYWPPHLVIMDGQTLEPMKIVGTRGYTYDTNEYHPEPRVAAIVASDFNPEWVVNIKETGYVWLVNYSNLKELTITEIEAEQFLHDGGWDATKRYFMPAANMRDTIVVIDTKLRKEVAKIKVGTKPHPGRGANWVDPQFGPVSATVHLGEGKLSVWGSDPAGHPQNAWKVVRTIPLKLGAGSLFLKTNPKSKHLWMDFGLSAEPESNQSLCVMDIDHPEQEPKCWKATDHGRIVHEEYNRNGDEVWVSVWDKQGEIIVYDDKTLKEKTRIKGLVTPTGKFNVYNTMNDIY